MVIVFIDAIVSIVSIFAIIISRESKTEIQTRAIAIGMTEMTTAPAAQTAGGKNIAQFGMASMAAFVPGAGLARTSPVRNLIFRTYAIICGITAYMPMSAKRQRRGITPKTCGKSSLPNCAMFLPPAVCAAGAVVISVIPIAMARVCISVLLSREMMMAKMETMETMASIKTMTITI